jgi:hypothetical protein
VQQDRHEGVVEIAIFKLKAGVGRDELLATVDGVSAWAQEQSGFISRDLTYVSEGDKWVDVIWWASLDDATAAMDASMTSESCAPMFAVIDMESTEMIHGESVTSVGRRDERVSA